MTARPLTGHDARSLGPAVLRLVALLGATTPLSGCCAWPFEDSADGHATSRVVAMPLSVVRTGYRKDAPLPAAACTAACGASSCFPSTLVGATGIETAVVVCNDYVPSHCEDSGFMSFRMPSGRRSARLGADAGAAFAALADAEEASVGDFARLAVDLHALGAPPALLARVARARRDEVRHAEIMRGLAKLHRARAPGGRRHRTRRVAPEGRRTTTLGRLARENVVLGCLGETWGAALLAFSGARAAEQATRRQLVSLSRDEIRHAALAFAVHRWLWPRLSPREQRSVGRAFTRAATQLNREVPRVPSAVRLALGPPTAEEHAVLAAGAVALVRAGLAGSSPRHPLAALPTAMPRSDA